MTPSVFIDLVRRSLSTWMATSPPVLLVTRTETPMSIPLPMDPEDPTTLPLLLQPTDVITMDPESGRHGTWTFLKAEHTGRKVRLEAVAADERTPAVFYVDRWEPIHVAPRGNFDDVWGAA